LSDSNAYLEENLVGSNLIVMGNQTFAPENRSSFNTSETVNWRVEWTLRDGTTFDELPESWAVEVECAVIGMDPTAGSILANGLAECLYPMANVAPGGRTIAPPTHVQSNRCATSVYLTSAFH
jgi:hypothetical protein